MFHGTASIRASTSGFACLFVVCLGVTPGETKAAPAPFARAVGRAPTTPADDSGDELRFEQKPWKFVLCWLAEKTKKGIVAKAPLGSFTFVAPRGTRAP